MKRISSLLLFVTAIVISVSCSSGGLDRPHKFKDGELGEVLEYESANEALLDYAANSEYLRLLYLEITSEGFTKPLLGGDEENFDDQLLDEYYAHMEHMAVNFQSYKAAADAFAEAGFMNPDTKIAALTIINAIGTVSTVAGLISFGNYLKNSGEEGRKAMVGTFRAMSLKEQVRAFKKIPVELRKGTKNPEEFIQMVDDRGLNDNVNRLHHALSSDPTIDYGAVAEETKNGPWTVFKKVGTEGLNNGFDVALEAPGACASGDVSVGVGMTLLNLSKKGYKIAKFGIETNMKVFTGSWLLDVANLVQGKELVKEANAMNDRYKAQQSRTPVEKAKIKIKAPKEEGKIAVLTRKSDPTPGYPTTYIAPVGKGTSEVVVEEGEYEIVVADKDGYVDTRVKTFTKGQTYEEKFDTSKNKPGADQKPSPDPGTNNVASVEKKIFGQEITMIEVDLKFIGDYKVTTNGTVTMDNERNISMKEQFNVSADEISKRVDKTWLIYDLKRHSFNETHEGYDFWERYDNTTVIKVNRKTGKIDYIDCKIDEQKENIYWTTEEFTDNKTKHTQTFGSIFEFTIDKPIGRDSGNWIMFYSNDPKLNAGISQRHTDDGKITDTELTTIHYDGSVIQVYME